MRSNRSPAEMRSSATLASLTPNASWSRASVLVNTFHEHCLVVYNQNANSSRRCGRRERLPLAPAHVRDRTHGGRFIVARALELAELGDEAADALERRDVEESRGIA